VGEITEIKLDEEDANLVLTDIQIQHGTPVHTDSFAQALALGITGVKYVQISPGSANKGLLREVSKQKPPVIPARRGKLDDIVDDLSSVAASGAEAIGRINKLLSDGNISNISSSISDVQVMTGELRTRKDMFAKLDSAFGKLDAAAGHLEATVLSAQNTLGTKDKGIFADIAGSTADLRHAVSNLNAVFGKVDGSVGELSTTTIPRANFAIQSAQEAADRLNSLAFRIEQNPGMLLTSTPDREVEIPK
jgi:phospholipid/cholesterol/gamma-HCH transport system substrate-binding protein